MNGELGEHLPVDLDLAHAEVVLEGRVVGAVLPRRAVHPADPHLQSGGKRGRVISAGNKKRKNEKKRRG